MKAIIYIDHQTHTTTYKLYKLLENSCMFRHWGANFMELQTKILQESTYQSL